MAIDSADRTVDITVEMVAENADRPMITDAITAPRVPTASRARAEKTSSILASWVRLEVLSASMPAKASAATPSTT